MDAPRPTPPLSSRAARVLAELCAARVPVTIVPIGQPVAIQGTVSFAHGGRAAVQTHGPLPDFDGPSRAVVLTALVRDRALSLTGRVREVGEQSVSLELEGDLRGSDPRRHARVVVAADRMVSVTAGSATVTGQVRDVCERGLAVLVDARAASPAVGTVVTVAAGTDVAALEGRVCHRTLGVDRTGWVRLGIGLPAGADARDLVGGAARGASNSASDGSSPEHVD